MEKSEISHAVLNEQSRLRKADKIVSVLEKELDLSKARVLDIGTGSGHIPHVLGQHARRVDSVDLYDERLLKEGYIFHKVTDERLPFEADQFDVVVSNQVVEHVPDQQKHMSEIARVLKPGGLAYLATPNKFWLSDPHHELPFISWLPRPLANRYLRAARRHEWDIYPLSYWSVCRRARRLGFKIENMASQIIKQPTKYSMDSARSTRSLVAKLPMPLVKLVTVIAPSFIFILRKPL